MPRIALTLKEVKQLAKDHGMKMSDKAARQLINFSKTFSRDLAKEIGIKATQNAIAAAKRNKLKTVMERNAIIAKKGILDGMSVGVKEIPHTKPKRSRYW